jgi:hypothetical protein
MPIVASTCPESALAGSISDASSLLSPVSIDWTFNATSVFGRTFFSVWAVPFLSGDGETESIISLASRIVITACTIALIAAIANLLVICYRRSRVLDQSDTTDEKIIDKFDEWETTVTAEGPR